MKSKVTGTVGIRKAEAAFLLDNGLDAWKTREATEVDHEWWATDVANTAYYSRPRARWSPEMIERWEAAAVALKA